MSIVGQLFHLLDGLNVDQKEFAEQIGINDKVVSKWKTGALKSYTKYLSKIVAYFGAPPSYFLEDGVFKNWNQILKYPHSVFLELRKHIDPGALDYIASEDEVLLAWLDKRMRYGITAHDELSLAQWFDRRIRQVTINPSSIDEKISPADVHIDFLDNALFLVQPEADTVAARPHNTETEKFLDLFSQLPPDKQDFVLAAMRGMIKED